jgi:hypothetical protein
MAFLLASGRQHFSELLFSLNSLRMEANDIVFWFSIVVAIMVAIWAVVVIRAYDRIDKN